MWARPAPIRPLTYAGAKCFKATVTAAVFRPAQWFRYARSIITAPSPVRYPPEVLGAHRARGAGLGVCVVGDEGLGGAEGSWGVVRSDQFCRGAVVEARVC